MFAEILQIQVNLQTRTMFHDEKENANMINTKKIVSAGLACTLAIGGMVALNGCSQVKQLIGQGEIGQKFLSSRHVEDKDRENYATVQDVEGNVYTTVIYIHTLNDNTFNVDEAQATFSELGLNWYQMIASSSMGTSNQETCYLYFPSDHTLTQLIDIVNAINATGKYNATLLTLDQYNEYVNNVKPYDVYNNETTYFGPAAQAQNNSNTQ